MDHANYARRLRDKAEECRVIAQTRSVNMTKHQFETLAETYDALADDHDRIASNMPAGKSDLDERS
jgi:hypothetical protein